MRFSKGGNVHFWSGRAATACIGEIRGLRTRVIRCEHTINGIISRFGETKPGDSAIDDWSFDLRRGEPVRVYSCDANARSKRSADLFYRSAAFCCQWGTNRRPQKQVCAAGNRNLPCCLLAPCCPALWDRPFLSDGYFSVSVQRLEERAKVVEADFHNKDGQRNEPRTSKTEVRATGWQMRRFFASLRMTQGTSSAASAELSRGFSPCLWISMVTCIACRTAE